MRCATLAAAFLALTSCASTGSQSVEVAKLVRPDQERWLQGLVQESERAPVQRIVVLGDSLSDTGRLHARTRFLYPADVYWRHRASNGPLWIDYVSRALDWHVIDYAVAGATTGTSSWLRGLVIPSLHAQLDQYLDETTEKNRHLDLLVLWIGPNNYLSDPDEGDVDQTIKDMDKAIQELRQSGVRSFVIGTMPELGGLPAFQKSRSHDQKLREFTRVHNKALNQLIQKLKTQYRQQSFVTFDAHAINQETIEQPLDYGFRNVTQACYRGDFLGRFDETPGFCHDSSGHKFWDQVHPNSKMHCYYAAQFLTDLQSAGLATGASRKDILDRCRKL